MPAIASSAPVCISTNANPRLRPVSRSLTICAPRTVPNCENAWTRSSLVVSNEMFPTYNFLLMVFLWAHAQQTKQCAATPRGTGQERTGCCRPRARASRTERETNGGEEAVPLRRYRLDCLGCCEG